MRRTMLFLALTMVMMIAMFSLGLANPKAPTNGGNGAGMSGQCTGAAWARPTSCQSP
jgi:hypothetical protein